MPEETIEENSTQPFDMGRYLDIVRRRHMIFLVLLLLGWAAVWGSSWLLPARYKSTTLILVEEPAMPKNYVEPNVNDNLQDRLQSITQQILSRTRLLLIIDKLHLYQGERQPSTPDGRVEKMRKDIGDIELVKDPQTQGITAFRINYSAPDPHIAQQVTSELTNLFIDENLKVQQQESENTTQFIESQLETARASLADQDARVRAFQAAHEGELPTEEATNLQILSGLQAQLQNEQDALATARQQSVFHQSLIEQYRALNGTHRTTAPGSPSGLEAIDQQLDKLQSRLQELKTRYTDQYPEVQQVKAEIADTEKTREQMIASLKKPPDGKEQSASGQAQAIEDPAQNAPLLQLQGQFKADQLEISNRQAAIENLKSRINLYQARLSGEPAVGQQLADLTRGYEQSQQNYNELLKKENDSQMATSMEQMQQGERFMMIDPPSLPLRPDFPNRLKMCEAGLGAGVALGLLVVVLLEFRDDRLYSEREIEKLISVPVICEIPEIPDPSDTRRKKLRMALGWAMAALVVSAILSGSAFSYLHS
jgi:polysaccharide chain length determinant protein (PEP-CTERM system associated)